MEDTSHLHIEFFVDTVEDAKATRESGFPRFKDQEMIRIRMVGDKNTVLVNPADAISYDPEAREQMTYKQRFPRHYAAFLAGREYHGDGTPIDQLPGITGAKIAEFKGQNIHTIEALAQMDGPTLNKLGMFARDWKDKASGWLEKAKESALDSKLAQQNEALQAQLRIMQEKLAQIESDRGEVKPEPKADPKAEVVTEGQFAGHTASDLRTYIKSVSGTAVKGNPSLATLRAMAEDVAAQQGAEA